jgi:hypothetical protein
MRGGHGVGTRGVHAGVDRKGGTVDRVIALDDLALLVHQHQV